MHSAQKLKVCFFFCQSSHRFASLLCLKSTPHPFQKKTWTSIKIRWTFVLQINKNPFLIGWEITLLCFILFLSNQITTKRFMVWGGFSLYCSRWPLIGLLSNGLMSSCPKPIRSTFLWSVLLHAVTPHQHNEIINAH